MNSSFEKKDCKAWEDQIQLFTDCVKSCPEKSSFVLLTHHVIWADLLENAKISEITNAYLPAFALGCSIDMNFENIYYPRLLELKKAGHQVICISGDAGTHQNKTGYWSRDRIQFILAGMGNSYYTYGRHLELHVPDSVERDKAVVFTQKQDSLSWIFVTIDKLMESTTPE